MSLLSNTRIRKSLIDSNTKCRIELFSFSLHCLCQHNTFEFVLEPLDRIFLGDSVAVSQMGSADLSLGNTVSWSSLADEEVHTVNTSGRIVLDTQINVFADTESKVSGF